MSEFEPVIKQEQSVLEPVAGLEENPQQMTASTKPTHFVYGIGNTTDIFGEILRKNKEDTTKKIVLFVNKQTPEQQSVAVQSYRAELSKLLPELDKLNRDANAVKFILKNFYLFEYFYNKSKALTAEIDKLSTKGTDELKEINKWLTSISITDNSTETQNVLSKEYPTLFAFHKNSYLIDILYNNTYFDKLDYTIEGKPITPDDEIKRETKIDIYDKKDSIINSVKTYSNNVQKIKNKLNDYISALLLSKSTSASNLALIKQITSESSTEQTAKGTYVEIEHPKINELLLPFTNINGYPYEIYEFIVENAQNLTPEITARFEKYWTKYGCWLGSKGTFTPIDNNFVNLAYNPDRIEKLLVFYSAERELRDFRNPTEGGACKWITEDEVAQKWLSDAQASICSVIHEAISNFINTEKQIQRNLALPFYGKTQEERPDIPDAIVSLWLFLDVDGHIYLSIKLKGIDTNIYQNKYIAYSQGCVDEQPKFSVITDYSKILNKAVAPIMTGVGNVVSNVFGFFNNQDKDKNEPEKTGGHGKRYRTKKRKNCKKRTLRKNGKSSKKCGKTRRR